MGSKIDFGKKLTIISLGFFMVLFAAMITMLSSILPKITELYSLSLSQVGTFTVVENYVSVFIGTFLILSLGDRFPKGIIIGISAIAMSLLLFGIDTLPPYGILLCLFSVAHLAGMLLNNIITAFAADLFPAQRGRYISIIHLFYSAGALLGPKLPSFIESAGFTWNHSYAFLGSVTLVLALLYFPVLAKCGTLRYKISSKKQEKEKSAMPVRDIVRHPMFLSLCLLLILYSNGHQNIFSNWLQLFLQKEYAGFYTPSFTAACMTVYWTGMLASRVLSMSIADRISPVRFITVGSALGVLIQIMGLFGNSHVLWIVTCLLLGLCTGGIYPLIHAVTISYFPDRSAAITSLTGVFGALGGIAVTWLMGQIADRSFFTAMFLPVVCLALVFLLMRAKFREHGKQE